MATVEASVQYVPAWGKTFHTNITNGENPKTMFFIEAGDNVTITISNYTGDHTGTIGLNNMDFGYYYNASSNWVVDTSNRISIETRDLKQSDVVTFWVVVVADNRQLVSGFLDSGGPSIPVGGFDWNITRSETPNSWDAGIKASLNRLSNVTTQLFQNQTNLTDHYGNLSERMLELEALVQSINTTQRTVLDELAAVWDNGTHYRARLDELFGLMDSMNSSIDELWANASELSASISSCIKAQEDLLNEYSSLSLEVQHNNRSLTRLEGDIEGMRADIVASLEENVTMLQDAISGLDAVISEFRTMLEDMPTSDDLAVLRDDLDAMETWLGEMNATVEEMMGDIASLEEGMLLQRTAVLESLVESMGETIDDLVVELARLEERVRNDLEDLNETMDGLTEEDDDKVLIAIAVVLGIVGVVMGTYSTVLVYRARKSEVE